MTGRDVCPLLGLTRHPTADAADAARRAAHRKGWPPVRHEKCGACFGWHLVAARYRRTHLKRRRRARQRS